MFLNSKTHKSLLGLCVFGIILMPNVSLADKAFCYHPDIVIGDDYHTEITWVVVSSVERTIVPRSWRKNPNKGCAKSWHSLGRFYRPVEVISGPRLGKLRIKPRSYLSYESSVLGDDEFVLKMYWTSHFSGKPMSTEVRYKVKVVGRRNSK